MSSTTKEVITLQCGHYSNFIGAHWWNIQESSFIYNDNTGQECSAFQREINSDVLFREGVTPMGEVTYTPRLLALDLKGSLDTLKPGGVLYDTPLQQEGVPWGGDVTLHTTDQCARNEFLTDLSAHKAEEEVVNEKFDCKDADDSAGEKPENTQSDTASKLYFLDDKVNVWSDYLKIHLHPKTIQVINEYTHQSEVASFDAFTFGYDLHNKRHFIEEFEDNLHFFIEECDHMQGFQVLLDMHDGFSGLGSYLVEHLSEDFGSKGMLAFAVSPPTFPSETAMNASYRVINSALCLEKLGGHSSLAVPMSLASALWRRPGPPQAFPHLNYNASLNYHTSAILAMAMENATLPYRLDNSDVQLAAMGDALSILGRKIAALSMALPLPLHDGDSLASMLSKSTGTPLCQSLTPCVPFSSQQCSAQSVVMRGVPIERLTSGKMGMTLNHPFEKCLSPHEMLQMYLSRSYSGSLNSGVVVKQPCKVVAPFPHIFQDKVNIEGLLADIPRHQDQGVASSPVMSCLQSSGHVGNLLTSLHREASKLDIKKFHHFLETGLEADDFRETLDKIQSLAHCYDDPTQ